MLVCAATVALPFCPPTSSLAVPQGVPAAEAAAGGPTDGAGGLHGAAAGAAAAGNQAQVCWGRLT